MNYILKILEQGGSIVPIVKDKISIKGWNQYTQNPPTVEQARSWEAFGYKGYGIIPGHGDIHVIDIDTKNFPLGHKEEYITNYLAGLDPILKSKLTLQRSINKGMHVFTKCTVPVKKEYLSVNPLNKKPICETIGTQNYVVTGAPGYTVPSGSLSKLQEITPNEYDSLYTYTKQYFDGYMSKFRESEKQKLSQSQEVGAEQGHGHQVNNQSNSNLFLSKAASILDQKQTDITANYLDWIKIGYSVANELGEKGRSIFHQISSHHSDYSAQETDKLYDDILKSVENNTCENKATLGTTKHLLKNNGVEVSDESTNKVAINTKTTINFLLTKGLYRNLFTNKVEGSKGNQLSDSDLDTYYTELREGGLGISKTDVMAIVNSDKIPRVDPISDFLLSAEKKVVGDEIERLMDSLNFTSTDQDEIIFYKDLMLKWFLQIPCMIKDKIHPRLVLVLIGETHIGKTEFFRRLLPPDLLKYYAESALDREKDTEMLLCEYLLVNIDELAGIMQQMKLLERFKSLTSARDFTFRVPYGKTNEKFSRKAILCGTSNRIDIIKDDTAGNSRLIPIELDSINHDLFNEIDKIALIGALSLEYKNRGSDCTRLSKDELAKLIEVSTDYSTAKIETHLVQKYVKSSTEFMPIEEIYEQLSSCTSQAISKSLLSRELKLQGFKKDKKRVNGGRSAVNGFFATVNSGKKVLESYEDFLKQRSCQTSLDKD